MPPHERLGTEPTRLDGVLLACLAKKAEERPESAAAVARLLDGCTDVPAWTGDDARAWWQKNETALRARHEARVRALSTVDRERTVAVNWRARTEPALG